MPEHRMADRRGYVREHRYLFEKYHNCSLLKWAHIHHKNGNKIDNSKENLEGMTVSKHTILHAPKKGWRKDMSNRVCLLCGSKTTYLNPRRAVYIWARYKDGFICHNCDGIKRFKNKKKKELVVVT